MGMTNSAASATGEAGALTMAMVRAPAARADLVAAIRSGLRPDCEITMNSASRSFKRRAKCRDDRGRAGRNREPKPRLDEIPQENAGMSRASPAADHAQGCGADPKPPSDIARRGAGADNSGDDIGAFADLARHRRCRHGSTAPPCLRGAARLVRPVSTLGELGKDAAKVAVTLLQNGLCLEPSRRPAPEGPPP